MYVCRSPEGLRYFCEEIYAIGEYETDSEEYGDAIHPHADDHGGDVVHLACGAEHPWSGRLWYLQRGGWRGGYAGILEWLAGGS